MLEACRDEESGSCLHLQPVWLKPYIVQQPCVAPHIVAEGVAQAISAPQLVWHFQVHTMHLLSIAVLRAPSRLPADIALFLGQLGQGQCHRHSQADVHAAGYPIRSIVVSAAACDCNACKTVACEAVASTVAAAVKFSMSQVQDT